MSHLGHRLIRAFLLLAGVSVLRFGADSLVVEHRDYWNRR